MKRCRFSACCYCQKNAAPFKSVGRKQPKRPPITRQHGSDPRLAALTMRGTQEPLKAAVDFLRKRLLRIYPMYWIVCTLSFVRLLYQHKSPYGHLLGALLLTPNYSEWSVNGLVDGSWTLVFEMFFYATVFACLLLLRRKRAILLACGLLSTCAIVGVITCEIRPTWNVIFHPLLLEFVSGVLLAMLHGKKTADGAQQSERARSGLHLGCCSLDDRSWNGAWRFEASRKIRTTAHQMWGLFLLGLLARDVRCRLRS